MLIKKSNLRILVDARAIASDRVSGIGHTTVEIIRALERQKSAGANIDIVLVVPMRKIVQVKKWGFKDVTLKRVIVPMRIINVLERYRLLPPMDLILGRGVYIFPNYASWPLMFSRAIVYIYDVSFIRYPEFVSPRNLKMLQSNVFRWAKRANLVVAPSKSAASEIKNDLSLAEDKVKVVTCGVDNSIFYHRDDTEIAKVKRTYKLPDSYLLYFGNIEPRKNLVNLIKAYSTLPEKLKKEYGLVLAGGDGWLNEDIYKQIDIAKKSGDNVVKVDSYVEDEDLPALYSGAAVLLQPSHYEGFGLSPLQAMACGVPVIVSKVTSLPEVVSDAGLYVEPSNVQQIGDKIELILSDNKLKSSLVGKGLKQASRFSWDDSARTLLQAIKEID